MAKGKTSSALVPVAPPKERRVVGRAIETNPVIAAIAQITPDKLDDIAEEIATTENYLAGLKAMHHVGSIALGVVTPPVAAVVVDAREAELHEHIQETIDKIPWAETTPAKPAAKRGEGVSMSGTIRNILAEHADWTNDQVIAEAKKRGVTQGDGTIRQNVYQVRSRLKIEAGGDKPAATKPPAAKPAAPKPPAAKPEDTDEKDESEGLPPKDSPFRAEAELTLRKKVAEYVFKKGLVPSGAIIRDCKVSPRIINDFMNHPWFESHMQQWRLTTLGKNEGLVDF